jgi:hypothetical protein
MKKAAASKEEAVALSRQIGFPLGMGRDPQFGPVMMLRYTGIIDVASIEEVVDRALAFHYLPLLKGRRTAVISGQGGTGVGTAEAIEDANQWRQPRG